MRLVRWTWLLPIVAGAIALTVALTRSDAEPPRKGADRSVTTFVARDASGNGHDGIIQGPVEVGRPGYEGSAYSFARRGSWIMVPPSPDLNPNTSDFLVTAWVQVESNPDEGETYDILRKGIAYTVPGEYKLELLSSGQVRCSAKNALGRLSTVTTRSPLTADGSWHPIGCARTGAHWSVLLDEEIRTVQVNVGDISNSVALSIGSKYGLEDRPIGLIDEVKLVINPDESPAPNPRRAIRELRALPPVAWWRLDEAAATRSGR